MSKRIRNSEERSLLPALVPTTLKEALSFHELRGLRREPSEPTSEAREKIKLKLSNLEQKQPAGSKETGKSTEGIPLSSSKIKKAFPF